MTNMWTYQNFCVAHARRDEDENRMNVTNNLLI